MIRLPPRRLTNFVFAWCLPRVADKDREEWVMSLAAPLQWEQDTPGEKQMWTDEDEARTWADAQAKLGA